jgi:hypothetical protein
MTAKEVAKEKEKRARLLRQEIGSQTSPAKRSGADRDEEEGEHSASAGTDGGGAGADLALDVRRELAVMYRALISRV